MKRLVAVDGTALMWRGIFGAPALTRRDGVVTGAAVYFMRQLARFVAKFRPSHIVIAFDGPNESFRKVIDPSYKSLREKSEITDADRLQQQIMQYAATCIGCAIQSTPYEADDILASCAAQFSGEVILIAADKDAHQSVSNRVRIFDWTNDRMLGVDEVHEKWGVPPHRVAEVQALAGDGVDSIGGVHKLGIKTASKLMRKRSSVESLLLKLDEVEGSIYQRLLTESGNALRSALLTRMVTEAPLPPLTAMELRRDWVENFAALGKALEASNFVASLSQHNRVSLSRIAPDKNWVSSEAVEIVGPKRKLFGSSKHALA